MPRPKVVITGIGVVSSIGIGQQDFFDALLSGESGIRRLSERDDEHAKPSADSQPDGIWIGAPVLDFNAKEFVRPRKALKVMCREIQLSFSASMLAIKHAGLDNVFPAGEDSEIASDRVGTIFGGEMLFGPPQEMADSVAECFTDDGGIDVSQFGAAAKKNVMPLWMLKYLPNMPACHVGISINAHGPNNTLVLGDVAGPAALIESQSCVQRGIADVVVSGSIGNRLNTTRMNCRYDWPVPNVDREVALCSRPHAPDASGVVGGEAAVTFVLESGEHALARGAEPLAVIAGAASRFVASEAIRNRSRSSRLDAAYQRGSARAIELAIRAALEQSGLTIDQVGLVVSGGCGDPMIDSAERDAMDAVGCGAPVTAPIAALGHTGAAAGSIAMATGALAIARSEIPPTVGVPQNNQARLVVNKTKLVRPIVLCLAHSSEGSATAVILTEPPNSSSRRR